MYYLFLQTFWFIVENLQTSLHRFEGKSTTHPYIVEF